MALALVHLAAMKILYLHEDTIIWAMKRFGDIITGVSQDHYLQIKS